MNVISYNKNSIINTGDISDNSTLNQTLYSITPQDDILEIPQKIGVPINFPDIIGRDEEVDELYDKVFTHRQRVAITGVSGKGKTFLSLHCAKRWSPDSNNFVKHILFFNCQTDNDFKYSLNIVARILKTNTSDEIGVLDTLRQIYTKLDRDKCLFIYDNIDSYDIIRDYFPPIEKENFYVIATSQTQKWGELPIEPYPLEMLKPEAAKEFILKKLNRKYKNEITDHSINDLVSTFDGYPLGLTQAVSFINNELGKYFNKFNVNEIIENYVNEIKINLRNDPPKTSNDKYRSSVKYAILKNYEKVCKDEYFEKSPHIKNVIDKITQFVSFSNPDKILPESFHILTIKTGVKKSEIEEYLGTFIKYSIIDLFKYNQIYKGKKEEYIVLNIHRMVQCVLRDRYKNNEVIEIICRLIQCYELDSYYSQIDFWCSHVDENVVFDCNKDEWEENCKLLVSTPKTAEFITVLLVVLKEENKNNKSEEFLKIFCEELRLNGNVYIFKKSSFQTNPANDFFMETFKQILESHGSSVSEWEEQVRVLESKNKCLGPYFGDFNNTYDCWAGIHWYAWWNWIEKLKEFEVDQLISPGWKNWTVLHVGALNGNTDILKLIPDEKLKVYNDIGVGHTAKGVRKIKVVEIASYFKHAEYLKILLDHGWNGQINSPYHNCTEDTGIVKILHDRGGNMSKLDLLKRCLNSGNIEAIKMIIKPRMNLNSLDKFEQTSIRFLIKSNIIDKNQVSPDFNLDDKEYESELKTILHRAVRNGTVEIVNILLKTGVDINQKDFFGSTALHYSVSMNKFDMVELLLKNNAQVDIRNNSGDTPLHFIGDKTSKNIIELLLTYGANIKVLNNNKQNVLMKAVTNRNFEIVPFLIDKGTDINLIDSTDYTVLQRAVLQSHIKTVELLLKSGADVNASHNNSEHPLRLAVMTHNIDMLKLLLQYKPDINLQSKNGDTALHWAGTCLSKDAIKLLLEHGAKPNIANEKGETPLHSITKQIFLTPDDKLYSITLVQLLIDNGADADAIDNDGNKPIYWADKRKQMKVSQLLRRYTTENKISYFDKKMFSKNNYFIDNFKVLSILSILIIIIAFIVYFCQNINI